MNEKPDPDSDPNLSDLGRAMLGGGSGSGTPGSKPAGPWIPPSPAELAALLPGYEIVSMLGRGGMGAVYMGRQISLDRPVAIKILSGALEESDLGFKERFKNEARAMAKLSHPGIVAVHDFGETADGLLYIVMEYVDGTDVSRMIAAEGRLHTEYAMAITAHVCDALAYAHERGIIHRDIKPANIMVGYDGVVKVADFGLAKVHGDGSTLGLTMSGVAMGTMHYIAPEAMSFGTPVDQRADLYAVGVMLYQMLTGRLPQGMFEMPSMQVPGLDPRYDGIIARAMREDPEDRYPSARDLRADLDAILTQPVPRIEDAPTQAVAALPTRARPQRPGAKSRVQAAEGGAKQPAKERSPAWIAWVALGLVALGGGVIWLMQSDKGATSKTPPSVAVSPPATDTSPDGKSIAKTTEPAASVRTAPATPPSSPASTASTKIGSNERSYETTLVEWKNSGEAEWRVENGALTSDSGGSGLAYHEFSSAWFELTGEVFVAADGNGGVHFQLRDPSDINNGYEFQACGSVARGKAVGAGGLFDYDGKGANKVEVSKTVLPDGVFTPFRLLVEPGRIQGWMGGTQTVDVKVTLSPDRKVLGFSRWSGKVAYRNLQLRIAGKAPAPVANPLPSTSTTPAPPDPAPSLDPIRIPEVASRIANYQQARHAQLSDLAAKYRAALVVERTKAAQSGVLASVTAVDGAVAAIDSLVARVGAALTEPDVGPMPPLAPIAPDAPSRVGELRGIFVGEVEKIERALAASLDQSLAAVQTTFVQTERIDEAQRLENFRGRVKAKFGNGTPPALTESAPTSLEEALLNYHWEWRDGDSPPEKLTFSSHGVARSDRFSWLWRITGPNTVEAYDATMNDTGTRGRGPEFKATLIFDASFSTLSGDTAGRKARYAGKRLGRITPSSTTTAPAIPADAFTYESSRYKLFSEVLTWNEAKAKAEAMGGHLATVTSSAEDQFVKSVFVAGLPAGKQFWIGGKQNTPTDPWQWTTGEKFDLVFWVKGEPNNANAVDNRAKRIPPYYLAYYNTAKPGWNDISESDGRWRGDIVGYLVEWKDGATAPVASSMPSTTDEGFIELFAPSEQGEWRQCGKGGITFQNGVGRTWFPGGGFLGVAWYAKRTFRDFVLEAEFLTMTESFNSGLRLRFPEPGNDPAIITDEGYEVTIYDVGAAVEFPTGSIQHTQAATSSPMKPPGEWNTLSVEVVGQSYTVTLNGVVVTRFTGDKRLEGYIGIENHNRGPVEFRNVRIKELNAGAAR